MQSELPESVRRAVCEYGAAAFNSGTAPDDAVATTDALTAREGAFAAILAYDQQCREEERARCVAIVRAMGDGYEEKATLALHPDMRAAMQNKSRAITEALIALITELT